MNPGDIVLIDFPQHQLHNQRVRVESIEIIDLAHPDCDERMPVEIVFYSHPSLSGKWGISRERIGGTIENARLRQLEREDSGEQGELLL